MRDRISLMLAVFTATLGFVLFSLAGLYTIRQQNHVNAQLCQSTVANRVALRATWRAARRIVTERQDTEEEKRVTNELFDGILQAIPPLRCVDSNPSPVEH